MMSCGLIKAHNHSQPWSISIASILPKLRTLYTQETIPITKHPLLNTKYHKQGATSRCANTRTQPSPPLAKTGFWSTTASGSSRDQVSRPSQRSRIVGLQRVTTRPAMWSQRSPRPSHRAGRTTGQLRLSDNAFDFVQVERIDVLW